MYYIDQETGEKKLLNAEQLGLFKDLLGAIADEDSEYVDLILDELPILAHALNEDGDRVLSIAARQHNLVGVEIVKIIMLYGVDPYAEDADELTPINYIDRITDDPVLKGQFCDAMNLGTHDTRSLIRAMIHEKSVKIVEAEYAARDLAEASAKNSAYERAGTYEEKVAIDPIRAAREYFERDEIKQLDKTIGDMKILSLHDITTSPEAKEAINSLYNLYNKEKSDRLEYSVDEGVASIMADMFGAKKSDIAVDTKASILESLCDFLGIDFIQLGYLLNIAYASGFLPIYRGFPGNPDDEFNDHGPSGGAGIIFDNPNFVENEYIVTVLGNGTIVVAQDHSI